MNTRCEGKVAALRKRIWGGKGEVGACGRAPVRKFSAVLGSGLLGASAKGNFLQLRQTGRTITPSRGQYRACKDNLAQTCRSVNLLYLEVRIKISSSLSTLRRLEWNTVIDMSFEQ